MDGLTPQCLWLLMVPLWPAISSPVALMLQAEPENPKCFAEGRKDFTCFWVEDEERAASLDQYSFTYTYRWVLCWFWDFLEGGGGGLACG